MTKNRIAVAVAIAIALLLFVGAIVWWPRDAHTAEPTLSPAPSISVSTSPTPSPSPSPSPTPSPSPSPSPTPSKTRPGSEQCANPAKAFKPASYTIDRVGAHERVIPKSTKGGQIPAPPLNDRRSAAWWSGGPKPGSDRGKIVLTIHTYRPSLRPALGNELFKGGQSALQPGDILKVHGTGGEIVCYEFTKASRVMVSDYDPDSTLMLDPSGPSSAVIVICWDFNKSSKDWDSRVFFQFKQLKV